MRYDINPLPDDAPEMPFTEPAAELEFPNPHSVPETGPAPDITVPETRPEMPDLPDTEIDDPQPSATTPSPSNYSVCSPKVRH